MVNAPAIFDWEKTHPWRERVMVEQDLIISRALVALFNDDYLASHLAFRGGTTLHKLYLQPQPRYSEDIDLVQINAEPIKETIDRIRDVLSFLGVPKIKQKAHNNTLIFRFNSEILPVIPTRLKVEINTREYFNALSISESPSQPSEKVSLMRASLSQPYDKVPRMCEITQRYDFACKF